MGTLKSIGGYGKIWNLGHAELEDLFSDPVTAQEKVDGSQISFGRSDDSGPGLMIRSKGVEIYSDALGGAVGQPGMFERAIDAIVQRREALRPNTVYRGEYLQKPKHNTLAYDRVPKGNVILFDVEVSEARFLRYDDLYREAATLNFEAVPLIGPNTGWNFELMQTMLETTSVLGGQKIEGIVFKNYERFNRFGHVLMGKHVSEAFKETHTTDWKTREPGHGDVIQQLGDSLRTDARWAKAVQHLEERGELQHAPQDIGPLMRELREDLMLEEEDAIAKQLMTWAFPKIMRIATGGFPEWYKERLAAEQFDASA